MCTALLPFAAFAQVIISEIMYDAPGSDQKAEWIELQNVGTSSVDIAKWKIHDGSNHILNAPPKNGSVGTTVLEAGGYLVLASDATTFIETHAGYERPVIDTTLSLSNDGETISLFDAMGAISDKVKYSVSKGADGTGESLQKISGKFSAAPPTPGFANAARPVVAKVKVEKKPTSTNTASTAKKATVTNRAVASVAQVIPEKPHAEAVSNMDFSATDTTAGFAQNQSSNPLASPWTFGALATGVAATAAILVSRQKKRGEWDITEIENDE